MIYNAIKRYHYAIYGHMRYIISQCIRLWNAIPTFYNAVGYSFNMQGIGVIIGGGAGDVAIQKCRLIALQFRQNFKPRVDFVHYSPSQRSFYAITTSTIRHHNVNYPPSLPYIYANPTQSNISFRHTYSNISIAIIIVYHPHIHRHIHR